MAEPPLPEPGEATPAAASPTPSTPTQTLPAATRDETREEPARDDALSEFDEELLRRVQAQLERIDFSIDQSNAAAATASPAPAGADAQAAAQQPQIPEGFTLPKTKQPLALGSPKNWTFFDWVKNAFNFSFSFFLFLFFILSFIFWRLAYDAALGWLLHKQSKQSWFTERFRQLAGTRETVFYGFARWVLTKQMPVGYDYDAVPVEYNAWLIFRIIVDIVLANDLVAYAVMCFKLWEFPDVSALLILSYIVGLALCVFTLWAKTDAYRVVKDFAWYWGDFFFLVDQKLTFDRVFSLVPHPMYTIGYGFFYGCSLITQSYAVFYTSLFGHFCQFVFLSVVENPHIEKIYGDMVKDPDPNSQKILYDKQTGYFRRDLIVFKNLDLSRSSDVLSLLLLTYVGITLIANLSTPFYVIQAALWRILLSGALGFVLFLQSRDKWWTKLYIKKGETNQQAFESWKSLYNTALTMSWATFICCALKCSENLEDIFSGRASIAGIFARIALGLMLVALNLWSSVSISEVLGDFGWFYGDFFISEVPRDLYYTGIYRYFNNPDCVTGFAGYYGLALISGSWFVFALALFSQACNYLFVLWVETPHMEFLYGSKVRQDSGVEQAIKAITKEALSTPQMQRLRGVLSRRIDELKATAEKSERYRKIVTSAKQRRDILKHDADRLIDTLRQSIDVFIENAKKLTRDTRLPAAKED